MQSLSEFLAADFLTRHGAMLLAGATALLAIGSLAVALERSPIHRQRLGEITIAGVLLWLVLACLPLPRFLASALPAQSSTLAENTTPTLNLAAEAVALGDRTAPLRFEAGDEEVLQQVFKRPAQTVDDRPTATDESAGQIGDSLNSSALGESDPNASASDLKGQPNVTAATRASIAPSIETLVSALPAVFLFGLGGCLAWLLLGQMLLWRIRASTLPAAEWLTALFASLSGVDFRGTRLIVSPRCGRAMTWGAWRPTIALPVELCQPANAAQLRQVLLHELGHVVQRDARGTLLFNLAFPLLYFHPLYWWLRSRARLAGELIADDWAAGHSTPAAYAGELIQLASTGRAAGRERLCCLGTTSIFQTPTQFYRRMHMLLDRQNRLATGCSRTWRLAHSLIACVVIGVATASVGVQPAGAQAPADDAKLRQLQAERDDLQKQVVDLQAKLKELAVTIKTQGSVPNDPEQSSNPGDIGARLQQARIDFKKMRTGAPFDKEKVAAGLKALAELHASMKKNGCSVEEMLDEVYFLVLQRAPTDDELAACSDQLKQHPDSGFDDLALTLLKIGDDQGGRTNSDRGLAGPLGQGGAKADPNGYDIKSALQGELVIPGPRITVIDSDRGIAVHAAEKRVAATDGATGKMIWTSDLNRPIKPPLKIKVAADIVTVLDNDSRVIVFDQKTGKVLSDSIIKADPNAKANKGPTPLGDEVFEVPTATVFDTGRGIQVRADEKSIAAFDSASGKVIWKSELNGPVKPPLKVMVAGDNVTLLDNNARVIVVDQKTGKVIDDSAMRGDPIVAGNAIFYRGSGQAFNGFQNNKSPYGEPNPRAFNIPAATGELDLISLATAYADAVGNVEIAKVRIMQAEKRLKESPGGGEEDVQIGQINLKTADRKVAVLHAIAEEALRAAIRELESTKSPDRQSELKSRAVVLKTILQVDSAGSLEKPAK